MNEMLVSNTFEVLYFKITKIKKRLETFEKKKFSMDILRLSISILDFCDKRVHTLVSVIQEVYNVFCYINHMNQITTIYHHHILHNEKRKRV